VKADPKDPRFRPFRIAMYSLFVALCVAFALTVIFSVVRSVRVMTPSRPPDVESPLTVPQCLQLAERLWNDLEEGRKQLTAKNRARSVDEDWAQFRIEWVERLRGAESKCATRARGRGALRNVFARLDKVQDLYTTHAVQFAREIGGAVDGLRLSLAEARREAGKK
jgi:hypothetical protein